MGALCLSLGLECGGMEGNDVILASIATRQHGIVTRAQARRLGVTDREIDYRLQRGMLVRFHEGVYRHAAAPASSTGRLLAAVLACGAGAAASHRSAAALHGLRTGASSRPEVTVRRCRLPRHENVLLHRTNLLEPVDITTVNRVPVTTIPRTLLDLGSVVPVEKVELAAQDAIISDLVSTVDLICVLERVGTRGRRGTAALRAVVHAGLPPQGVASQLELRLLRLIEQCQLPPPILQYELRLPDDRRVRLDAAWPELRVGVDADGRRWHSTRQEFEHDLQRSRAITAAGWRHLRYGWADVQQRGRSVRHEIAAVVGALLAA